MTRVKSADQCNLELLYEQITEESFELLREEQRFVEECIKQVIRMTDESLDKYANHEFGYRTTLRDFGLRGAAIMACESAFKGALTKFEEMQAIIAVLNSIYMGWAMQVLFLTADHQNFVSIKLKHKTANVPWNDKKEVKELLENNLKECIQTELKKSETISSEYIKIYFQWRNKRLPVQKMEKKLPELEGVF